MLKIIQTLFLLFFLTTSKSMSAAVPASELDALTEFADWTNFEVWTNNTNWKTGDPCDNNWFGVWCNLDGTSVKELHLPSNNLTCCITPKLGDLTNLAVLDLNSNSLAGTIPAELGNLVNLVRLELQDNQLVGGIPSGVAILPKLTRITVRVNLLNGQVPTDWSDSLQRIELGNNKLIGGIPASLGSLPAITGLDLQANELTGTIPAELGSAVTLTGLLLGGNHLEGHLPPELASLTNLEAFFINTNKLTGNIPGGFVDLVNLIPGRMILRNNGLYTSSAVLDAFLDAKGNEDWSASQTIAPGNISDPFQTADNVTLNWDPIEFTTKAGRYHVWYSESSGGPYNIDGGTTDDKSDTEHVITGITPETKAYFVVIRTETDAWEQNVNPIISEESNPEYVIGKLGPVILIDGFESQ